MHCPHCHQPLTAQVHLFADRQPAAAPVDHASTYTPPPSELPPPPPRPSGRVDGGAVKTVDNPPPRPAPPKPQAPTVRLPVIEGWTEDETGAPGPPKIGNVVLQGGVATLWSLILTTDIAAAGYTGTAAGLREYLLDHCEHADRRDIPSVPWMPNILDQLADQLPGRVRRNVAANRLTYTITPNSQQ